MVKDSIYRLTESQKRIWHTQMIYPESTMFVLGGTITIYGKIDILSLKKSICAFVNSHDAFQIRIKLENEEPVQYFSDDVFLPSQIEVKDFSHDQEGQANFLNWVKSKSRQPFLSEEIPLYDFAVYQINENTFGYLIRLHHVIADGWSIEILTNEINDNYTKMLHQEEDLIIKSDCLYKDIIHEETKYLQSRFYERDKKYWKELFSPLPQEKKELLYSLDGCRKTFFLSEQASKNVRELCDKYKITVNSFFVGLYLLYINKVTGKEDIVIGNPVIGRYNKRGIETFGMCVNSLAIRYQINENDKIEEIMQMVHRKLRSCFMYQRYPYNHLLKDLGIEQNILYTSCVNYYNTSLCKKFQGLPTENLEFYNGQQEYDFQMIIREWQERNEFQIDFDYKVAKFTEQQINEMFHHLEHLINILYFSSDKYISQVCLLTEHEKDVLLNEYNNTSRKGFEDRTILNLIEKQSKLTPHAIAIQDANRQITYAELENQSDRLAEFLLVRGIKSKDIIGIFTYHSVETVIGILGVLKTGAAYLPMDIYSPSERVSFILKDAGVNLLLSNVELKQDVDFSGSIIKLDNQEIYTFEDKEEKITNAKPAIDSKDLAYIIYTSGSTGKPKGVMIEHHSLLNYAYWAKEQYKVSNNDVFPLYSSLSFDLTITSIFTPLISGSKILVYRENEEESTLLRIMRENVCTIVKLTPAHLLLLKNLDNRTSKIRELIVGGEILSQNLSKEVVNNFGGDVNIFNEYGPTEATVGCMIYPYDPTETLTNSVPIGRPIMNTKVYVLDKNLNPVPIGVCGELYISGEGVARGYLNKPELTQERFITESHYGNLYYTGDIVRFIREDCMEYVGRKDEQVKINGYRIELTEIELCLQSYRGITYGVVIPINIGTTKCLCAYYVAKTKISEKELRTYLEGKLMKYMVPKVFVQLENIPTKKNGKIDKKSLPLPDIQVNSEERIEVLSKEQVLLIETIVAVLGVKVVSLSQNFYHLGGDSIHAIQISARLNEQGYRLKTKDILSYPILSEMLSHMEAKETEVISQENSTGEILLTPIIKWFFEKIREHKITDPNKFSQGVLLELSERWNVKELEEILQQIILHHDILRLNYDIKNNTLFLNNVYFQREINIKEYTVKEHSIHERQEFLNKRYQELVSLIDISNTSLMQACIVHTEKSDVLILVIHHLAIDGVSWRIVLEDIQTMLSQRKHGQIVKLPMKTYAFNAWATYEMSHVNLFSNEMSYWKESLRGIELNHFNHEKSEVATLAKQFDIAAMYELLVSANKRYGTTIEVLLITSLVIAVQKVMKKKKVLFELESHGRDMELFPLNISRTVGWFTSMYPISFTKCADFDHYLKMVKEKVRGVPNNGIGYGLNDYIENKWDFEDDAIRFNYLGSLNASYEAFKTEFAECLTEFNTDKQLTCMLESNFLINSQQLSVILYYNTKSLQPMIVESILSECYANLADIINFCCETQKKVFTPSDFDTANLTQEELDMLIL